MKKSRVYKLIDLSTQIINRRKNEGEERLSGSDKKYKVVEILENAKKSDFISAIKDLILRKERCQEKRKFWKIFLI